MNNFLVSCLVLLVFAKKCSPAEVSVLCTTGFCDEYVQRFPCPPLDPVCSDPGKSLVIPSPTICNCCEHCFIFQEVGDDCVNGGPGQPLPNVMCGPGATCVEGKCKERTDPDPDFYPGYECIERKCHCAVLENGAPKKIFGTFDETINLKKEKQCQCSISAYMARKSINQVLPVPDLYLPVPRCLPNGQFDPLQCIDNMCGCVNRTTGAWNKSVAKVPIAALGPKNPKCFEEGRHKIGEYYTMCERERNDLMAEELQDFLDKIDVLHSHKVQCTLDGQYAVTDF